MIFFVFFTISSHGLVLVCLYDVTSTVGCWLVSVCVVTAVSVAGVQCSIGNPCVKSLLSSCAEGVIEGSIN